MINNPKDFLLLEKLTAIPGVPGREYQVAELIRRELSPDFEITTDPLGNLIAHLPGNGKKIMFLAHMDEVGLIVQRIAMNGYLYVERLGGISVRSLPASRMDLWTEKGRVSARVGILPGHLDHQQWQNLEDCYIDIGALSQKEVNDMGVQIGDVLTWCHHYEHTKGGLITCKALDDRSGCFVLLQTANSLVDGMPYEPDLYFAFCVQEETMLGGGLPIVQAVAPDIVIGIDGTLSFDTPEIVEQQSNIRLGAGPALKWMDAIHGKLAAYVPDLNLNRAIRCIAADNDIPLQNEVHSCISTAITPIPYQVQGIRTAALSLPVRYHHTPIETVHRDDIVALQRLLSGIIQNNRF